jgi:threonine/homoserine/homoserine lactone efflux protein
MSGMILTAFQLGFVYSLLPGPILFASSQRVVTSGLRQGCWFILGVTLADLIYIALIHWGLSGLLTENRLLSTGLWILGAAGSSSSVWTRCGFLWMLTVPARDCGYSLV